MILDSAQSVFAASGYANAGAEEVARAAGVAPSAIYRYFPSKRELYLAALRDAGPRLLSIWTEAAGAVEDPLDAIWRVGLDYYDHAQTRSPYARLWFQALGDASDPEVRTAIAGNFTAMVDLLAAQLGAGQARGLVRSDLNPRIAAWHFLAIGLTFDLVAHLGLDDELDRERVEEWGRLYIESIREEPRGTIQDENRGPRGGTLPLRQPRGDGLAAGGGDPLPAVQTDPPHPLGTGGNGGEPP